MKVPNIDSEIHIKHKTMQAGALHPSRRNQSTQSSEKKFDEIPRRNNKGGSIFRIIDGPSDASELEHFFEAKHNLNAGNIAKTFGVDYTFCDNESDLNRSLNKMYSSGLNKASLLEVTTENELNPEILKRYFRLLKNVQ